LTDFNRYRDGYQAWCRACQSAWAADYYKRNREKRVDYNRRQRAAATTWYSKLKEGKPCMDCGGVFHPAAMQWDHPPGVEKVAHVAQLYRGARQRVLDEIAKCELVCANCHAIRTYRRKREEWQDPKAQIDPATDLS
jgi:hypothetical protein